jgi:tetratricopeptide (TPR) repeat protein
MRAGEMLIALKRPDEAFDAFSRAASLGFARDTAAVAMSKVRLAQGRKDEALALAKHELEGSPDSVRLLAYVGDLELQRGRAAEAEERFRAALRIMPDDEESRLGLARTFLLQKKIGEAIPILLVLAEERPRSRAARSAVPLLLTWADDQFDAGRLADARRAYDAVLRTGERSEPIFLNLALTWWRVGRKEESLAVLELGVKAFPGSANLHYRTGRVLQALGRHAEAEAELRRALAIAPGREDASRALDAVRGRGETPVPPPSVR